MRRRRIWPWFVVWLPLVAWLATSGWAAEPFPQPSAELPAPATAPPVGGWAPELTDEERAVVEHLELLETMAILENLDVLQDWDVVTAPPRELGTQSPPPRESSYGDLPPK